MFFRLGFLFSLFMMSACSNTQKIRLQEREKISSHSGLLCDFVNGDEYQDVEVELNMQMGRRCDSNKNFTISAYKNSADIHGVLYCCALPRKEEKRVEAAPRKVKPESEAPVAEATKPELKLETKADVKAEIKTETKTPPAVVAPKANAADGAAAKE